MPDDTVTRRFAQLVRDGMTTRNVSVRKLAEELDLSTNTIENARTGKTSTRLDIAVKLAERLGFDLDQVRG